MLLRLYDNGLSIIDANSVWRAKISLCILHKEYPYKSFVPFLGRLPHSQNDILFPPSFGKFLIYELMLKFCSVLAIWC